MVVKDMKIKQDKLRNSIIYFACILFVDVVYFLVFMLPEEKIETFHYILLAIWTIPAIAIYWFSISHSSLYLDEKELLHQQFHRIIRIPYQNIAYIDEELSRKKRNIYMITYDKKPIVITMDRKKVLLDEMLKRCKNRLPVSELKKQGFFDNLQEKNK